MHPAVASGKACQEPSVKKCKIVVRDLMVVERAAWWNPRVRRILKAAPLVVMFLLLNTRAARAVCSFSPKPNPTADGSSDSLRHAIQGANASGEDCTIELVAGTYTLTIKNTHGHVDNASSGGLDITDSGHTVTIEGKGAGVSIVNANGIDRVFQVLGGANAAFSNLTIEGGLAQDDGTEGALPGTTESEGGGVLIQDGGHVTLTDVWVEGNQAVGGKGANGVCGPMSASSAGGPGEAAAGGGLFLSSGAVNVIDSQLSSNIAVGGYGGDAQSAGSCRGTSAFGGPGGSGGAAAGGGVYVASGSVALSKSALSGNNATGGRGGLGYCPACFNRFLYPNGDGGAGQGAGLFIETGILGLGQTTVSSNSATGGNAGLRVYLTASECWLHRQWRFLAWSRHFRQRRHHQPRQ